MDVETKIRAERIKEIAQEIRELGPDTHNRMTELECLLAEALEEIANDLGILRERGR